MATSVISASMRGKVILSESWGGEIQMTPAFVPINRNYGEAKGDSIEY